MAHSAPTLGCPTQTLQCGPHTCPIFHAGIRAHSGLRTCGSIELSVSPSPQTQTSQWQSSISCTASGTRTSLGFSAIEKHWKIRSSHRIYGVYVSKIVKRCALGTCNTDSMYPERMGHINNCITFPESKQNSKISLSIQPQYK